VQKLAGAVVGITGVLLIGQGIVGTSTKPQQALPVIVDEWDYDDWFDFDVDFPPRESAPPPKDKSEAPWDASGTTQAQLLLEHLQGLLEHLQAEEHAQAE
jgi:hypothetical protein